MKKKVEQILNDLFDEEVQVERASGEHGDYASNIAFTLCKKEKRAPSEVAKDIKNKIKSDFFEKVEEKNGFLNFFLSQKALKEELLCVLEEKEDYGKETSGKTVVIDYSSPNIAKSFGVGHLRSTIIGQALYNIYDFHGWNTVGVNHLGDWGTQYGKLLYQIKKEEKDPENLSIEELEKMYVRFHEEAEKNPAMEEEGRKWFAKLEKGDKEARRIWEVCREKSLKEFQKIYDDLEVNIDYVLGESFYEDKLQAVIEEAKEKKVVRESKGALIIEFDDMPPAMILKSDGSTTYLTRDLAAAKYRLEQFSPALLIYEIGADQTLHMKQLFCTVEKLGWAKKERFVHVPHGMFRLKEGKFSTRKGRTVHLEEVLSLAKKKAEDIIKESATEKKLSKEEVEEAAKKVGVGAVKYNDLKRHHKRDVVFDWDRIITLKGDSGPYIQYSCVRCKSILEKAGSYKTEIGKMNEEEKRVVKRITQFKEAVESAKETFSPNIIAEYAFGLAKDFNSFYDMHQIIKNNQRLAITESTYIILKQCLKLLGIAVPQKM
jgi:arginyl-tRNA synthetase